MAKPTEAQVKALEKAHKQALVNLLQAIRFRYIVYQKLGENSAEWKKYAGLVNDIGRRWYKRQVKLEKGGATKEGIAENDLFTYNGNIKLRALAKKWDAQGTGIGFIPLLIWAVVAIIGFFTADEIVDELNTTTEEQQALIEASDKICKEHNFNTEECKQFMVQQNTAVANPSSSFLGITPMKLALGAGVAYVVINRKTIFKSKSASNG